MSSATGDGASRAARPGHAPLPCTEPEAPLRDALAVARPVAGRLALATLLGAGAIAAAVGLIATSAWLISRSAQHPQESAIALAIVGVQFFALSRGLLRYGERLVGHDGAFALLARVRVRVYEALERLAPMGLPAFASGDLLTRLVADVDSLQDLLLRVLPPFAIALTVGLLVVALEWAMLPAAGLILLVALLIAATLTPWLTGALAARAESRQAQARAELTASAVDLLEGAAELVVNGATQQQLRRTARSDAELRRIGRASARTSGAGQALSTVCSGLAMCGALLVGADAVSAGQLDGVLLAGLALIPLVAFELVAGLPAATQTLQRVRRSAARVQNVLDSPAPVLEPARPRAVPPPPHRLSVRDLRCRYPGTAGWALDGVDLELAPGRRVALVGPSGAGKSTLAAALLRFLPYQGGSISIDGVEITELKSDACRRVVGLVTQDAHLFDSTLDANLRLARPAASKDELWGALSEVRLLEWVQTLPAGLSTELGEHGARMSGGQRQRLALARALLADFPILILDEPAEHLDAHTADAIVGDMLAATERKATLMITHRLTGLRQVDEVLLLDGGRVLERGTHAELISLGGRYARAWARELDYA